MLTKSVIIKGAHYFVPVYASRFIIFLVLFNSIENVYLFSHKFSMWKLINVNDVGRIYYYRA